MSPVPIRAIVGRFAFAFSREALERVLRAYPFEFCADISTGEFPPFSGMPVEHQERFASSEVRNAHYMGVDWNQIAPIDEELVMQMRECESVFMAVASRLESKKNISYLTRKLWYLRHLQFWNDYLTRQRINLYLAAWIPHEIPDIIIYHLCRLRGIPVLYFDVTVLRDVSLIGHDVRHAAVQLGQRYQELMTHYVGRDPREIPLGEPFASYEKELITSVGQPPALEAVWFPAHWKQLMELLFHRPIAFLKHALHFGTPAGWMRAWGAGRRRHILRRMERFYAAHASSPDLAQPFVYFPSHYQPEASSVPMGGVFADQILVARLLNAVLPKDVLIYVKEHPRMSGRTSRSIEYYKEFLELSKVRLLSRDADTFALREHCRAVVTITGSAGFEALFRMKPVFLFGSCYYQYARGVFPIRSLQDCRAAVQAVFERGEAPTLQSTHVFLEAMEETCVAGVSCPWYMQISHQSPDVHAKIMGDAIVEELAKMQEEIARVATPFLS
ncbi:MAG: hypothetical protein PHS73_04185 [Candidatus Peribacteraceae bacterium]|nr:hypothetical protein [Candidatus Peribacteraceae bacterium]